MRNSLSELVPIKFHITERSIFSKTSEEPSDMDDPRSDFSMFRCETIYIQLYVLYYTCVSVYVHTYDVPIGKISYDRANDRPRCDSLFYEFYLSCLSLASRHSRRVPLTLKLHTYKIQTAINENSVEIVASTVLVSSISHLDKSLPSIVGNQSTDTMVPLSPL